MFSATQFQKQSMDEYPLHTTVAYESPSLGKQVAATIVGYMPNGDIIVSFPIDPSNLKIVKNKKLLSLTPSSRDSTKDGSPAKNDSTKDKSRSPPPKEGGQPKLFFNNIDTSIPEEQLRTHLAYAGPMVQCSIPMENGMSKGFAFVRYKTAEATDTALAWNLQTYGTKKMYVQLAKK